MREQVGYQREAFVGPMRLGRQTEVDQRQVRRLAAVAQGGDAFGARGGGDDIEFAAEEIGERVGDQWIVIDDQQRGFGGCGGIHPRGSRARRRGGRGGGNHTAVMRAPHGPRHGRRWRLPPAGASPLLNFAFFCAEHPVAGDPLIQIRDLSFGYDQRAVLSGINMQIPRGKLVAIMGASGCGKTTLLRLIGGQLRPTRGEVRFDGQVVHELDANGLYAMRRRMGMLFQFGALFTDMSVFDNVAFQMREHTDLTPDLITDLVLMKLQAVGLRGAQDLMPAELSGGMARRVALARAIALDPALIMYDEPFTGLDPIALGVIGQLIRRLNAALGASSIVVTHDVQESLQIVDYIYFVSEGKIVAQGTPDEIRASSAAYVHQFVWAEPDGPVPFHYPAEPYTRDLLGEAVHD